MPKTSLVKRIFEFALFQQYRLCKIFDRFLPADFRRWGYREFVLQVLPGAIEPGLVVADVGGGKSPVISNEVKKKFDLTIYGVDSSAQELCLAPPGVYDQTCVADICNFRPEIEVDLVIALAVLEHVADARAAMKNIAAMLKPGGRALIFVPCRNSIYARLNLVFPEVLKKMLLKLFFSKSSSLQGFRSYYDRCTPAQFRKMAQENGLLIEEEHCYFQSAYFSIFLPLHALYRILTCGLKWMWGNEAAETFTLVLRRPGGKTPANGV